MKRLLLLAFLALSSGRAVFSQVTSFRIDSTKFDTSLTATLDSIHNKDQSVRMAYLTAKARKESPAVLDSLRNNMRSIDIQKVNAIIEKHGWHYLPMIRTAEKNGEILSSNIAILEDRIYIRNGKKQIYGSQGFADKETGKNYIYPIIDLDNLDKRRKAMGLPPMEEDNKGWDLEKKRAS